jgi:hypothetical protein
VKRPNVQIRPHMIMLDRGWIVGRRVSVRNGDIYMYTRDKKDGIGRHGDGASALLDAVL